MAELGNRGKLLDVDLSAERISTQAVAPQIIGKYLGGAGLAARLLWDQTTANTAPLSEENPLVFMIGPITGTPIPTANRLTVAAISPLTNIWGEAHMGGTWAYAFGHTPYIGIVVHGQAGRPVYLKIDDDEVSIEDASRLWGLDTYESHSRLKAELGGKTSVITIGPAGEKVMKFAFILGDGKAARVAARSGMGAVMGSKKLKAITVRGTRKPPVYDEEGLKDSIAKYFPQTKFDPVKYEERRREISRTHANRRGCIRHWTAGQFDGYGEKSHEASRDVEPWYCTGCRTSCNLSLMIGDQRHPVGEVTLPFGSNCMIDNMEALAEAYEICNRQGLDGTSTGQVMALAFELYDKGLITKKDTDGIELTWGNDKAMLQMLNKIVNR